ncbi:hypothetical protein [Lutibacter sp.]
MKYIVILILALSLFSCNQQATKIEVLQNRIDSLEIQLAEVYKPGFGELMTNVQSHHSKLWFAGKYQNWKLAKFEIKELNEIIADIVKYQTERKENRYIKMMNPALDSISMAVKQKNKLLFETSYVLLTNSCNECHLLTNFEYNIVKIPDSSPFSNQDFKPKKNN